jgi:hypothetical protein
MTDNIFITNCKIEKFMQFLSKQINFHCRVFIKSEDSRVAYLLNR